MEAQIDNFAYNQQYTLSPPKEYIIVFSKHKLFPDTEYD